VVLVLRKGDLKLIEIENKKYLTTAEAAGRLGVSTTRVRQLITAGRLRSKKIGRDLYIEESWLEPVYHRKVGRPKKYAG
jgi:excisionase family DNA binding protein